MPGKREPPPRPKHDASYKSFFAHRRTVADTLRASAIDIAAHLDFTTLERMPASFVTRALDQRHADMLWRVQTTGGRWLYILVLLEFQSTVDPTMALRMTNYVTTIWMQLEADDLGPGGEFPFVLPIVIYNGGRPWTAATDIADLPAQMPKATLGYMLRHRYLLIEIQTEDPEQLPPFLEWIEQVVTERHGEAGRELRRNLRREGEPKVTTLLDRARQWGKERDEHWLQKGLEKGIKEERRASLQRERELVHRQVTRRFGPGTAEQLLPLLDRLSDPASIVAIADAVIECETGEEFLRRVRDG